MGIDEASETKTFVLRFKDSDEATKSLCLDDKILLESELIVE